MRCFNEQSKAQRLKPLRVDRVAPDRSTSVLEAQIMLTSLVPYYVFTAAN